MPGPAVVLASGSPRRVDLLAPVIGADQLEVRPASIDEAAVAEGRPNPAALVTAVARAKAEAVWRPGQTVLAADTIVVHDGATLGKPADRSDAEATLRSMRDTEIEVISAVVVMGPHRARTDEVIRTRVRVGHPTDDAIADYVATGAADDKAGSLAVQDEARPFISSISGCLTNVYGLPLCAAGRLLTQAGHPVAAVCPDCGDAAEPG